MHDVTEQIERLSMMTLLILFGGALVSGLLAALTWIEFALAAAIVRIVRPLAGLIEMIGLRVDWTERLSLAFFGIRGAGSIYYVAYALNHAASPEAEGLWAIVGLVILMSILIHGLPVTPIMRNLDRRHGRDPDASTSV